ncbi:26S proteasome non-ATPase regulatory subunit 10 [Frankliniella fusca]|uniref:26S proteasome non-ATPase regulatory subunit 10 n=1 Tax=Frankliniella fusca TaxID=407009 RepID=A0AAE1I198_9NEOP|nr:26S proteasome non-ATPase regulatory subunit 10 [Frankliniella fusca]
MALHVKETIHDIAFKGDIHTIKLKLQEDGTLLTKKDDNDRLLIHWAALGGHEELVKLLSDLGSPIDSKDDIGSTPLILAASAGKEQVVHTLLSLGVNVNSQNNEGHSALQYASSKGWLSIVQKLLSSHADLNITDKRGATPLHRAASRGNTNIVKELLACGNQLVVDAKDAYGNTPLHLCCEEDRAEEAGLLVQHGASLTIKNREEKTPLDLAPPTLARQLKNWVEQ